MASDASSGSRIKGSTDTGRGFPVIAPGAMKTRLSWVRAIALALVSASSNAHSSTVISRSADSEEISSGDLVTTSNPRARKSLASASVSSANLVTILARGIRALVAVDKLESGIAVALIKSSGQRARRSLGLTATHLDAPRVVLVYRKRRWVEPRYKKASIEPGKSFAHTGSRPNRVD